MARDYHLYPLDVTDPDYIAMHEHHDIPPFDSEYLEEFYDSKNSDRIKDILNKKRKYGSNCHHG